MKFSLNSDASDLPHLLLTLVGNLAAVMCIPCWMLALGQSGPCREGWGKRCIPRDPAWGRGGGQGDETGVWGAGC